MIYSGRSEAPKRTFPSGASHDLKNGPFYQEIGWSFGNQPRGIAAHVGSGAPIRARHLST